VLGVWGVILFTPLLYKIPILMDYFNIPKQEIILCLFLIINIKDVT